jgi:hypothetical protein
MAMSFVDRVVTACMILALGVSVRAQNAALGAWQFTTNSPEGTFVSRLEIREEGGKLIAVGKGQRGERPYDSISVEGSQIVLVITIDYNGTPLTITYRGQIDGKDMSGDADFGGMATGTWSASRQ